MPNNVNHSQEIITEHKKVLRVEDFDTMTLEERRELLKHKETLKNIDMLSELLLELFCGKNLIGV
jgi:hypothetical protein